MDQSHLSPELGSTPSSGKLSNLLASSGVVFGSTPQGKAWTLRALHPSDDGVRVDGIPDRTCVPTGMLHFKTSAVISNQGGNYDVDLVFIPSCILFGTATVRAAGIVTPIARHDILNSQLAGGPTLAGIVGLWKGSVASSRVVYYGVTVYLDAPALFDQGGLVVAQVQPSFSRVFTASPAYCTYTGGLLGFEQLMGLPLAVQHQAKYGAYVPIKLSQPSLSFVEQQQVYQYSGWFDAIEGQPSHYTLPSLMDASMGCISLRNVSQNASIRLVVRVGVEFTPVSYSPYSPFTRPSPAPDAIALDAYFRVCAQMPDGWTSDYNDLGKLVDVLKGVAKWAWPAIRQVVSATPFGANLLETGKQVVSTVRAASKAKKNKKKKKVAGARTQPTKK